MAQSERLSPPQIRKPVYDCAEVVEVSGFTAGASVHVFANGNERVGSATPFVGWWHIRTTRPLKTNELLTAVQEIGGDESFPTREPVTVKNLPGPKIDPLAVPHVSEPVYHCQQVLEATAVLPGAWVEVAEQPSDAVPLLGRGTTPTDVARVGTPRLNAGRDLFARQVVCGRIKSGFTLPVPVQPLPPKLSPIVIPQDSLVVGSNVIQVPGLVTGAEINVFAGPQRQRIAGGIAVSGNTIFPTTEVIKPNVKYWAEQALCELKSDPPADGGTEALTTLPEPRLRTPICPSSSSVVVEDTVLGALVKLYVKGQQLGQLTATGKETLVPLGDKRFFVPDDPVMATQEIGPTGPVQSATEKVNQAGARGKPAILGGHPFFAAAPGEQAIPGPVFLRGRPTPAGPGPVFRIAACAAERIDLTVERPARAESFPLTLVEGPGGHYTGIWDWSPASGTPPDSITVGKYIARFTVAGPGGTWMEERPFFVIFDPTEVSAPPRFVFDHTGVWFGTGWGFITACSYALHLSDHRVFGWAMDVIGGQTDPWNASGLLLQAEHQRFTYDLNNHGNDVLHLLEHETLAQCADDANMLSALLRASGIPAHPVTGDYRMEYGNVPWGFDTWVEARLTGPHGERWYALHPHQSDNGTGKGPVTRAYAGSHWGEAKRENNDMIVMAGANWVASDLDDRERERRGEAPPEVQYDFNTPCKRPSQAVNAKPWIENLTDDQLDRYWAKPFWECSAEYSTPIEIRLHPGRYMAGDLLTGSVEIRNDAERLLTGELSLLLAESRVETKVFADRMNRILTREVRLPPRERISVPFRVQLPPTVCADDQVLVVAAFADTRAIAYVDVAPSFDLEPGVPSPVKVGETFPLQLKITNRLDRPLTSLVIEIELPFACEVDRPLSTRLREGAHLDIQSVPPVAPGATAIVEWLLRVVSPATPAAIRIKAAAPGFGERRVWAASIIPDTRPTDYTDPVVPPTYAIST